MWIAKLNSTLTETFSAGIEGEKSIASKQTFNEYCFASSLYTDLNNGTYHNS